MKQALLRQQAEAALERLLAKVRAPRALELCTEDQVAIEHAVEKARTQMLKACSEGQPQAREQALMSGTKPPDVLAVLHAEVDRVASPGMLTQFDELTSSLSQRTEVVAARLTASLADEMTLIEEQLAPLTTFKWHDRFRGPFRTWLAASDFLHFGCRGIVRRFSAVCRTVRRASWINSSHEVEPLSSRTSSMGRLRQSRTCSTREGSRSTGGAS